MCRWTRQADHVGNKVTTGWSGEPCGSSSRGSFHNSKSSRSNGRMASEAERCWMALRRASTANVQLSDLVRDHFQQAVCPVFGGRVTESRTNCWMLGSGQGPQWGKEWGFSFTLNRLGSMQKHSWCNDSCFLVLRMLCTPRAGGVGRCLIAPQGKMSVVGKVQGQKKL